MKTQSPFAPFRATIIRCTLFTSAILFATATMAVQNRTDHTFELEEGETAPVASIEDAAWLTGSWTGTGFGKQFEATWNPPSNGTMVGLFKLYDEEAIAFYEILLLSVDEGTLSLKVKHFTPEFVSWEDKEDYIDFRLVKKEADALHFKGLSFYRRGPDKMDGYIVMRNGETITEHNLVYSRRTNH